jgi:ATP-dependent Lhr-like helicase
MMPVGRWAHLRSEDEPIQGGAARIEEAARRLLRRYGVLVRELCSRERHAPRWRDLLLVLRRMEARGEVRGGRFVSGLAGEQFALPEAVDALRALRRLPSGGQVVIVSAADPLNVLGILLPGERLSPLSGQVIAYQGGVPVEVGDLGRVRSNLQRGASSPPP